jgi:dipeptidyl aminopeptidase/acylaminoacyl peptidase
MTSLVSKIKFFNRLIGFRTKRNFARLLLFALVGTTTVAAQNSPSGSGVFPVPDTYKTEGIPAIKNSEVENLFYDAAAIKSNLIWDADRQNRRLLVTDETNSVWLLNTPMAQPVRLLEKIVPQSLKMRPGGEAFAYTSDHEDEDNYQLYVYGFKENAPKKVVVLTGKDESVDSFVWSETGDALFYVRADYDTKKTKLCRNDFQAEKCFATSLGGIWEVMDTDANRVLLKYWKASSSQHLYVFDTQADKLTPIDERGNSRKAFLAGDRVFWTSEGNENCRKEPCILSQDLKNGKVSQLNLPENLVNLNDFKVSPDGNHVVIQDTKDSIDVLRVFQLKKDKIVKEIPSFVSGSFVVWNVRWLSDSEIAYTLEDIGKPASIQSYNFDTKKHTDWTKERLPAQLAAKVKSPEVIRWNSFDNREISGYVVRPKAAVAAGKKSPVMIYVHGGPQILDKPLFNPMDIQLADNLGVTTIHTNIRGSSGFGKEFMDADNREKRGGAVKDVQALLDWIGKQPDLNANQIYLRGVSYGGFVVLSTALQEPSRIKGVIAEYPLVSIRGYLAQSWIDEFARTEYGDPKDEDLMKRLDALTPLNNTDKWNQIPLFITRGKLDARIPEKEVIDLKNQLQNKNSEVWFVYSTDGGHGLGGKYVTAAMYQFLKKQITEENKK